VSVWRRKALESFPELATDLTSDEVNSTYAAWSEVLLPLAHDAYVRDDRDLLARIFGYAAWSARQPAKAVWNAAFVSFYEHLFSISRTDDWMERLAELVPADVVPNAWVLWRSVLSDSDQARLQGKLSANPALKTWLRTLRTSNSMTPRAVASR
jgi:hypothetical protein